MKSQRSVSEVGLPERVDVVVVGAGYAGLSAALELHDHGIDVLVLEAGERVGGRTLSAVDEGGVVIDHGGQWIGPTQHAFGSLVERFHAEIFPTYLGGVNIEWWRDDVQRQFTIAGPEGAPGMSDYLAAMGEIDRLALSVNLEEPWLTPGAEAMDSETVYSYLERTVASEDARVRFGLAVQSVWTVEPRDISLLHFLFYIASAGGFEQLMEAEGCAQEARFVRGAQQVAKDIAKLLGQRVRLESPVRSITDTGEGVVVATDRGRVLAQRVVVATPPPATQRISFDPELPVARRRWLAKSPMGDVVKIHVSYSQPFWRERGLSGEITLYGEQSLGFVFDNSPDDGSAGVLVCFIYADRLARWRVLEAQQRRDDVIHSLVGVFGVDAGNPDRYVEKDWAAEPFIGGAYAANPTPGAWVEHGRAGWRAAHGAIHWAGTETASRWNGYIDGAVSSGRRAAAEVRAALTA